MMNNKPMKIITLLLAGLLAVLAIVSLASAFTTFVEPVNNIINLGETAKFILIIEAGGFSDTYSIGTTNPNWIVTTEPDAVSVKAGAEGKFNLYLKPKSTVNEENTYRIPVTIESYTPGVGWQKQDLIVSVTGSGGKVYNPTINQSIGIDKIVDPRQQVPVIISLTNYVPRELYNVKIVVDGEIFQTEFPVNLTFGTKTKTLLFEIDPLTPVGKRTATLRVYFEDKLLGDASAEYEIKGYVDLKETSRKDSSLFKTEETYAIVNKGNEPTTAEKSFSVGFFKRLFTHFTPDAVKEKASDGKKYYVIRAELGSEEQLDISVETNYRLLVLIIIIIIAIIVLYYAFRSPIIVLKNAEPLGKTEEGLSEVKIRLYLKNRSRKPVSNIRVVDTVPSIAEIDKRTHLGSMEPVSIGKSKRGTVPRWELDVLEAYEERIITYRIKSKLTLIGGIRLPCSRVTFDAGKGKERTTYSNSINLLYKTE